MKLRLFFLLAAFFVAAGMASAVACGCDEPTELPPYHEIHAVPSVEGITWQTIMEMPGNSISGMLISDGGVEVYIDKTGEALEYNMKIQSSSGQPTEISTAREIGGGVYLQGIMPCNASGNLIVTVLKGSQIIGQYHICGLNMNSLQRNSLLGEFQGGKVNFFFI